MQRRDGSSGKRVPWGSIAVWTVSAIAVAIAVVWAVYDPGTAPDDPLDAAALASILPTQADMAALVPRMELLTERDHVASTLEASPGFLVGRDQEWAFGVQILIAVFDSRDAALRAHADWRAWSSLPWHEVRRNPIGEACRYEPQFGWSVEFFRNNVYVMVSTSPGNEELARRVARLLDSKVTEALAKSRGGRHSAKEESNG